MSQTRYWIIGVAAAVIVLSGLYLVTDDQGNAITATDEQSTDYPAPIAALEDRGIEILQRFDTPSDLVGYAAKAGLRPVAAYVTPDGAHAIIGTMLDAEGNEVTSEVLEPIIRNNRQKAQKAAWPRLEQSHWVADGNPDADRILYLFTDPNCPYCHELWQQTRSVVASGKVQLRHVLVGILKPSSPGKAAAILGSDNPSEMLTRNEQSFESGGVESVPDISATTQKKLTANRRLMRGLNVYGTPAVFYRDASGEVRSARGVPSENRLRAMLGDQ